MLQKFFIPEQWLTIVSQSVLSYKKAVSLLTGKKGVRETARVSLQVRSFSASLSKLTSVCRVFGENISQVFSCWAKLALPFYL